MTSPSPSLDDLFVLATRLHETGRGDEAGRLYGAILARDPGHVGSLSHLAVLAQEAGRADMARTLAARAVALAPTDAVALSALGNADMALGRTEAAVASLRAALALRPDNAALHFNLGNALDESGRREEAVAAYRAAIAHAPDFVPAHVNLGKVLNALDRCDAAEPILRAALKRLPSAAEAHNALGDALLGLARPEDALPEFRAALALRPDFAEAHNNLGHALLSLGQFAEGWAEFEWRRKGGDKTVQPRRLPGPEWGGEPAPDRILLVHAEGGMGDVLQFMRFLPAAARRVGLLVVEVPAPLVRLVAGCVGDAIRVATRGAALPAFDLHLSLLSLPRVLERETDPEACPYLFVPAEAIAPWTEALPPKRPGEIHIGLAWQGNPRFPRDARRSIPLRHVAPLATLPHIRLVCLQKQAGLDQMTGDFPLIRPGSAYDEGDFADTAALIMTLDLVIAPDTAVAHLAGALGRPVWIVLPFAADWRWGFRGDRTSWYPHARLYRQPCPGDWDSVIHAMAKDLSDRHGGE